MRPGVRVKASVIVGVEVFDKVCSAESVSSRVTVSLWAEVSDSDVEAEGMSEELNEIDEERDSVKERVLERESVEDEVFVSERVGVVVSVFVAVWEREEDSDGEEVLVPVLVKVSVSVLDLEVDSDFESEEVSVWERDLESVSDLVAETELVNVGEEEGV